MNENFIEIILTLLLCTKILFPHNVMIRAESILLCIINIR